MDRVPMRVDVWSDYVCPWCYLAAVSLKRLEESHNIEIVRRAYELRPAGSPPIPPAYMERIKAAQPHLKATAKEVYGIEINQGPFGTNSRPALIGAKYAEDQGVIAEYHDAVFRAYWQEARSIDSLDVLRDIAVSVGLDADAFAAALDDGDYDDAVSIDVNQAQMYGLSGVPAMIFAGKYLVSGAQPYETLVNVVEQVQLKLSS